MARMLRIITQAHLMSMLLLLSVFGWGGVVVTGFSPNNVHRNLVVNGSRSSSIESSVKSQGKHVSHHHMATRSPEQENQKNRPGMGLAQVGKRMATATLAVAMTVLPLFVPFVVDNSLFSARADDGSTATATETPVSISSSSSSQPRIVGSLSGSGLFFKDTLEIESFDDPKVQGVKLYISNFQIPLTERLSKKNFFNDPSYASVACARGKRVAIADNIAKGPAGEEVFEESKSLLFKTLRVQRIYDEKANTIIYVSFNTRLDKNDDSNKSRFKSSLCAINLD